MKKSLLACSILLTAAGCAAENGELDAVRAEALEGQANLVDDVFVSKTSFPYRIWERDPSTGEYTEREVQAKARLSFIRAENYDLDGVYHEQSGDAAGLDYEVVVEHVVEETGQTFNDDMTFFARKTASGFWDFFDCNSTRNCQTAFKTRMEIVETAEGQQLRIENQNIYMVDSQNAALEFVEAR